MTRGLQVLLCALVLVLTSTPAWAHGRPENRVWGFSEKPADFAAQETAKPIDTPGENPGCGYDFASGVHKYLYCQGDPINGIDPNGFTWQTDFGRAVEKVIREDFFSKDRTHRYEKEVALSTVLGMPYIGRYRQRLDLCNKQSGNNYFYEIKHCTPSEIAGGYAQINRYKAVLGSQWRTGTSSDYTYGSTISLPIITRDLNGNPLPGNYYALVLEPVGGLITYIRIAPNTPKNILEAIVAMAAATTRVATAVGTAEAAESLAAVSQTATGLAEVGAVAAEVGPAIEVISEAEVGAAALEEAL